MRTTLDIAHESMRRNDSAPVSESPIPAAMLSYGTSSDHGSSAILLTSFSMPGNGALRVSNPTPHSQQLERLGSGTPAAPLNFRYPSFRIRCLGTGLEYRLPTSPRAGWIGNVQQDDCGSAPIADILNFCKTSSSIHISSSGIASSCNSENDLADLSHAGVHRERLNDQLSSSCCQPGSVLRTDYDGDLLRSATSQSLDECRHHGGCVAAAALRDEACRCPRVDRAAGQPSEPCSFCIESQPSSDGQGRDVTGGTQTLACELANWATASEKNRPEQRHVRRLCSAAGAEAAWTSSAAGSVGRRHSEDVCRGRGRDASASDAGGGGLLCSVDVTALRTSQGCFMQGRLPALPVSEADAKPRPSEPPASPAATPSTCAPDLEPGVAAGSDGWSSGFAACPYDASLLLDHELPDDSVHGGRPRHPSMGATGQPASSQLLEWAEFESATHAVHMPYTTLSYIAATEPVVAPQHAPITFTSPPVDADGPVEVGEPPATSYRSDSPPRSQLRDSRTATPVVLLLALAERLLLLCLRLTVLLVFVAVLQLPAA